MAAGKGGRARSAIRRASGGEEVIPSKIVTTLHAGDRVVVETAGGGGYGDPRRRSREAIAADKVGAPSARGKPGSRAKSA